MKHSAMKLPHSAANFTIWWNLRTLVTLLSLATFTLYLSIFCRLYYLCLLRKCSPCLFVEVVLLILNWNPHLVTLPYQTPHYVSRELNLPCNCKFASSPAVLIFTSPSCGYAWNPLLIASWASWTVAIDIFAPESLIRWRCPFVSWLPSLPIT